MLHPVNTPWPCPPLQGRHGTVSGEGAKGSGELSMCHVVRGRRACVCHGVAGRGACPLVSKVRRGHERSESKAPRGTHFLSSPLLPLTPYPQDQSPSQQPPQLPFCLVHLSSLPTPSPLLSLSPFFYPSLSQTQQMCLLNDSCHTHSPSFVHLSSPNSLPMPPSSPPSASIYSSFSPPVPSSLHPLPSALTSNSTSYFNSASETIYNRSLLKPVLPSPSAAKSPRNSKLHAAATSYPPPRTTPDRNHWCEGNEKCQPRKVTTKGKRRGITKPGTAPYTAVTIRTTNTTKSFIRWFKKVVVLLFPLFSIAAASYKLKPTTTVTHLTLAGAPAQLPCELPIPTDRPTLILWYKDEATKPFYSLDARRASAGHHKVHEKSSLGRRSRFTLEGLQHNFQTRVGFLEVQDVTLEDAGNYTCRVDFMTSQTMMSLVQLHVHEEIRGLEVFDSDEKMIQDVAGPYKISSRLRLSCRAYGGHPLPEVRWVSEGEGVINPRLLPQSDGTAQLGSIRPVPVRSAVLVLPSLARRDDGRKLRCEARSTNLTLGLHKEVTLTMHLPPLKVVIVGADKPMRAGTKATLRCQSTGSKPPATLTFTVEGSGRLDSKSTQTTHDQNTTLRKGDLWPTSDDHGRMVLCTAANPLVPDYTLTATKALDVHFAPEVQVRLAPALDPNNIKEGEDVYFECHVRANPPESRVQWLHQGRPLYTVKERGVLAQARNLVLQRVNRFAAGSYQCTATNAITTTTSDATSLDVMFAPECAQPGNVTVSITATEKVTLDCAVEANPGEVSFSWMVNSSRGVRELPATAFTSQGSSSRLLYQPQEYSYGHEQYGVIFCLGANKIGKQKVPCAFTIRPAGPPQEPVSCSLVDHGVTSLAVGCVPGHDGGLQQHFLITVRDVATQEVVDNINSSTPTFSVEGLAPGRDYLLLVTAANMKGQSAPYTLQGFAVKVAENKINQPGSTQSSPLVAVFAGVVSGFVFIMVVLAVATRSRCRRSYSSPGACLDNQPDGRGKAPPSPSSKTSLEETGDKKDEDEQPSTLQALLEHREAAPKTGGGSPTSDCRTSVPTHTEQQQQQQQQQQQPLHPSGATANHKYYKIKINCTRLNNESFV